MQDEAALAASAPTGADPIQDSYPRAEQGAYSYYVLTMLALVNMINYVDRNILSVLIGPIKQEFQVSDEAMGLLTGLAFMIVHCLFGLPLARIADRTSRRTVVAVGVAVWSAMTAVMGLAASFGQLLVLRMGVGIGEAAGAPPSHSLLSDYFPPEKRATALSLFGMGVYGGTMFGYFAAGWLGETFGWRMAFVAVGLPGLALAALVGTTVREPARAAPVSDESILFVLRYLLSRPAFVFLMAAASFHAIAAYAAIVWTPTFYGRVHGLSLSQIGLWLGLVSGIGGALGALGGGLLSDRLGGKDKRWYAWVAAGVALLASPASLVVYRLTDSSRTSLFAYFGFILLIGAYNGPLHAMNQFLAKPRMRSMSVAIQLLIVNLVGGVIGPWAIGRACDVLRPEYGEAGIRHAMAFTVGVCTIVASLFYLATSRSLRQGITDAETP
jgi:predicted MFS family arabinose efflux permease